MATMVFFHAHPDDECIATGGTMAKAAAEGHRVVLVTATAGELGEPTPGVLDEGEELADRRVREVEASARILGVARGELLGYRDSGMVGTDGNADPRSFWQADVGEAGRRLADLLEEEDADVLVVYDEHGTYGHPDHVQVHRVGLRAAELAGTARVFMTTMNRDHLVRQMRAARTAAQTVPEEVPDVEAMGLGVREERITHAVDVTAQLAAKKEAMRCHASQIAEGSFFLEMPDDAFAGSFGTEWFIQVGATPPAEPGPSAWAADLLTDAAGV